MFRRWSKLVNTRESQRILLPVLLAFAAMNACQPRPRTPHDDPTVEVPVPPVVEVAAETVPAPSSEDPAPALPLRLTILVSDDQPEYASVADALTRQVGAKNVQRYELDGKPARSRELSARLRNSGHGNIVSIGLLAALSAREVETANVVFCQVFNHKEHKLLSDKICGVEVIPRLDAAFKTWGQLGAKLEHIGVITGEGHEELVQKVGKSLLKQGIQLHHQVTKSDKETMVEFQRMLPEIDGYWLLPDNRVLSRSILRDLMSLARRAEIGVLVHDARLLEMGGVISVHSDPREIAAAAHELLVAASEAGSFRGTPMRSLQGGTIRINAAVATQLGYRIDGVPAELLAR